MVVCEQCGAENRDRARYCRGCTLPLVAVTVVEELDTVAEEPGPGPGQAGAGQNKSTRPCPECQAPNPRRSLSCLACGAALGRRRKSLAVVDPASTDTPSAGGAEASGSRSQGPRRPWGAWVGGVLALALAVVWWSGAFNPTTASPPVSVVAPEVPLAPESGGAPARTTHAVQPVAVVPALAAEASQTGADPAPAVTQLNQAVEEVRAREARKEAERVAAQNRARAARIAERQRVQEARILAAKEAEAAAAAAAAAEAQRQAAAAAVPAPPPAPAPRPVKTVEQTCAGETNIFARDFCRIDACKLPANVNDAICVSYRRMDAERRARMAN